MKRKKCRRLSNAGSSMVEVLIAFLVVMIMVTCFAKTVTVSVKMLAASRNNIEKTEEFNRIYLLKKDERISTGNAPLKLVMDTEKTKPQNFSGGSCEILLTEADLLIYTDSTTGLSRYSVASKEDSEGDAGGTGGWSDGS